MEAMDCAKNIELFYNEVFFPFNIYFTICVHFFIEKYESMDIKNLCLIYSSIYFDL